MSKKTKFNKDSNKISQTIKNNRLKILTKVLAIHNKFNKNYFKNNKI